MSRADVPRRPRRWGLLATWTLGITSIALATVALLGRAPDTGRATPSAGSADSHLVVGRPGPSLRARPGDAVRIDTFPAILSVAGAVEVEDGWVLLDGAARTIHVVSDRAGETMPTFGREGEGPGEMTFPSGLAVSGDQIGVVEARGHRLVRFDRDGRVLGPVLLEGGCGFGPARSIAAAPGGGFLVLRSCTGMGGLTRAVLLHVDAGGRVRVAVDRPLQSLRSGPVDPFATPVAAVIGGTSYLGVLSDACLDRVEPVDVPVAAGALCLSPAPPVPLGDSTRADLVALGERIERGGGRLEIPDTLPAFMDVVSSPAGLVFRVPLPGGRETLDLVEPGGRRIRLDVEDPALTFVGRRHLLLARELLVGTELAWVPRE